MKTQNRNMLLLFWLSSATLILTACGGGDDPSDDAPPPPTANATAHAGSDQDNSISQTVTLDGTGSTDPDDDTLSYSWKQVSGPDVTNGSGNLTGVNPNFNAPNTVSTLRFELTVNDGNGDSDADMVQINIMEDAAHALFVDGNTGSDDTGDGSRGNPFATFGHTLTQITPEQEDIYVMTLSDETQRYDESATTLVIPDGTSLYGGFTTDWLRDVSQSPSRLLGAAAAIRITTISSRAWFSGFDLKTINGQTPAETLYAISAQNGPMGILTIEDNTIETGDASNGDAANPGSNYGVLASNLAGLEVYRNTLTIGNAANGSVGIDGAPGNDGSNAKNRSGYLGDEGGSNGGPGSHGKGGDGGNGDEGNAYVPSWENGDDATGARAGKGGKTIRTDDADGGKSGTAGIGGNGGGNGLQLGLFDSTGYLPANGRNGGLGAYGGNGGGGRGGSTSGILDGGGGGGGGGGGEGGAGGLSGMGGGASIGIYTYAISGQVNLYDNTITAGKGGLAGKGGRGGKGGNGGNATSGEDGACAAAGCGWSQAGGGGGGAGGTGGSGGGGGGGGSGGPSIAVLIGTGISAIINNNHLSSANAGGGGQGGELGLLSFAGNGGNGSTGFNGLGNGDPGEAGDTGNYGETGQGGHGGWSYAIFDVVTEGDDGLVPSLSDNTLSFGQPGTAGGTGGEPGKAAEGNFSL